MLSKKKNKRRACAYLESLKGTLPVSTVGHFLRGWQSARSDLAVPQKMQHNGSSSPLRSVRLISPVPLATIAGSHADHELSEHHAFFSLKTRNKEQAGGITKNRVARPFAPSTGSKGRAPRPRSLLTCSQCPGARGRCRASRHTHKNKCARGTAKMGRSRKRTGQHIGVRHLRNASLGAREAPQRAKSSKSATVMNASPVRGPLSS